MPDTICIKRETLIGVICDLKDEIIRETDLFGSDEKDAVATINYIGGLMDLQDAVIRWIRKAENDA